MLGKEMAEAHQLNTWEGYVDWRNRPALKGCHGGVLAASFVLVVEVTENLAYLANASNLVLYLSKFMDFSPSSSANIVTNFMGTAFLLALLGGFLADAFFTTYCIYPISATVELIGLLILTLQAHISSLKPPICTSANRNTLCEQVDGGKVALLFAGLYLVALGVGGIKGSLPPHGAEQFDENTPKGRKQRSTFFNYYVFCLSCGALIAVTFVVWIEDNKGWQWGFGISTATILISIPIFLLGSPTYRTKIPGGSPITTIFKVLAAAIYYSCTSRNSSNAVVNMNTTSKEEGHAEENERIPTATQELKFLDRAVFKLHMESLTKTKRGKSFSLQEDINICKAWCHITEDPIVGNSQSQSHFWGRIYENFCSLQNNRSRTQVAIQSRWGIIHKSMNKFRGCLAQIEHLRPSGSNPLDIMLQAKLLYHEDEKKPFPFEHCWPILQNNSRWLDISPTNTVKSPAHTTDIPDSPMDNFISLEDDHNMSADNNPSIGHTPIEVGSASSHSTGKRPLGRKAAKQLSRKSEVAEIEVQKFNNLLETFSQHIAEKEQKKAEREANRLQAMQEMKDFEMKKEEQRLEAMQEMREFEIKKEEHAIMSTDISHMDPQTQAYFQMRKSEILAKYSAQTSNPNFYSPMPHDG